MASNDYHFVTTWSIRATPEEIIDVLSDGDSCAGVRRAWADDSRLAGTGQLAEGSADGSADALTDGAVLDEAPLDPEGAPDAPGDRIAWSADAAMAGSFDWMSKTWSPSMYQ